MNPPPAFIATPSLPTPCRRPSPHVCRRPPTAVLSPPSPPSFPVASPVPPVSPSAPLLAYERFLRSEAAPPSSHRPEAPVFATASGSLVCEWSPNTPEIDVAVEQEEEGRAVRAMLATAHYEAFLSTEEAHGIDPAVPVYCTSDGALVCHYDGSG